MKGNKAYHGYTEEEIFENDEDKLKILSLKDVEREKIIAERIEKLNHKKERDNLLNEKHFRNNDNNKRRKNPDSSPVSESESGEINENKNSSRRKKSSNSENENVSELSDNDDDDKQVKKEAPTISLEDIEKIRLTRDFFLKYYSYPNFNERVNGAFIRVNMSSVKANTLFTSGSSGYIIGQIEKIVANESKPYNFMGNKCTKYIKLFKNDRHFNFKVISNSPILEDELTEYCNSCYKEKEQLPTNDQIVDIQKNIEDIKKQNLKPEEINNILNQKKKDRIKYKDSTLNITEELDLAYEKYKYNEEKRDEAIRNHQEKEQKIHEEKMKEIEEDIKLLEKMKEERDKKAKITSDNDIVAKINEDILKKQKLDERNTLLKKKRRLDKKDSSEHKIFKRVDCHPSTLFDDISVEKKEKKEKEIKEKKDEEKERKKKKNNNNFCYAQKIKQFKDYISEKKNLIDEMMEYEKSKKKEEGNNIDMSLFFKLASINYDNYNKMIKDENKKNTLDPQVKIIGLSEYLKEYGKE